jgi:hypothetical protein
MSPHRCTRRLGNFITPEVVLLDVQKLVDTSYIPHLAGYFHRLRNHGRMAFHFAGIPRSGVLTKQQLGRLTHYAFDAVLSMLFGNSTVLLANKNLVSAFLAGVKHSTGLS